MQTAQRLDKQSYVLTLAVNFEKGWNLKIDLE